MVTAASHASAGRSRARRARPRRRAPRSARLAELEDPGLERQVAAEVAEPADPEPRGVGRLERRGERRGVLVDRERQLGVRAGERRQQRGEVARAARHRAGGADRRLEGRLGRRRADPAERRAEAVDVAERGRVAQRAHVVAAVGDRHAARRPAPPPRRRWSRRRSWRGRTGCGSARRPRCRSASRSRTRARWSCRSRSRRPPGCGATSSESASGTKSREQRRAGRRDDPGGLLQVLDRVREPVHPAAPLAAGQLGVALRRLGEQLVAVAQRHDRVQRRVAALDPLERGRASAPRTTAPARAIRSDSAVASSMGADASRAQVLRTEDEAGRAQPCRPPPQQLDAARRTYWEDAGALARGRGRRARAGAGRAATRRCARARWRCRAPCSLHRGDLHGALALAAEGDLHAGDGPVRARRAGRAQEPPQLLLGLLRRRAGRGRARRRARRPHRRPRCCACSRAGWAASCSATWASRPGPSAWRSCCALDDRGRRAVGGGDVAQRPRATCGWSRATSPRPRPSSARAGVVARVARAAQPLRARRPPLHARRGAAARRARREDALADADRAIALLIAPAASRTRTCSAWPCSSRSRC